MARLKNTIRSLLASVLAAAGTVAVADQPYHPFAEPLTQQPDWQWFAPVDVQQLEDLQMRQKGNYGWYLTYDRIHAGLDRPLIEPESNKFDTTWGNLWTFGVMDECDDAGWDVRFLHFSGPNSYTGIETLRPGSFEFPAGVIEEFPTLYERFNFDPGFSDGRYVYIRDSLNVASLGSFEVNRVWRTEPYQYGGFLEPIVGVRYMDFTDLNVADGYSVFTANGLLYENLYISDITSKNRMLLGQIGFRYHRDFARWRFEGMFKALMGGNFQTGSVLTQQIGFAGTDVEETGGVDFEDVLRPVNILTDAPGLGDKGVFGLDTNVGASYMLTKTISLRGGFGLLYMGNGIARGSQIPGLSGPVTTPPAFGPSSAFVQQNLVMPSVNLGITFNR